MELIVMIKKIITIIVSLWMNPIREEQNLYRRQSGHILDKYDPKNYKEDYLW